MMDFGEALRALKIGEAITRDGWNGKGQFAYLVPRASYQAQTGVAKKHYGEGAQVPYRPYMALKTAQGDVSVWVPSVSDILADDWEVFTPAAATRYVQISETDAQAIVDLLTEPEGNRYQPTRTDPLMIRYENAENVLRDAIADRAR